MKNINDNTVVRVRVPKHLYEAIQKKLALKETEENVQESMQDIVQYLSDPEVLKTLGMVATALGITGGAKALADKIKSSGTDISGITGAQHGMDEAKTPSYVKSTDAEEDMQTEAGGVEYAWIPAAAAGLGIAASMLKNIMSYMKQNNLKGMSGFMQAYKEVGKGAASSIERSKGVNEAEEDNDDYGDDIKVGIRISFKEHDRAEAEECAETYGLSVSGTRLDPNVNGELSFDKISEFIESLNMVYGISNTTLTNYRV